MLGSIINTGSPISSLAFYVDKQHPAITMWGGWDWIEDLGLDPRSVYQVRKLRHVGYLVISISINVKLN